MLQTKAVLPAAVGTKLRDAIALRMPELTPFDDNEVLFDIGPATTIANDRISVPVFVAPRNVIDEHERALGQAGVRIDGVIGVESGEAAAGTVPVFHAQRLDSRARRLLLLFAAGLMALLASAGVFHVKVSTVQEETAENLQKRIEVLREEVLRVSDIEREIEALTTSLTRPSSRDREQLMLLNVLDEVAQILPDDSYLSRFIWEREGVTIAGLSADAAALLKTLEVSKMFADARFSAPISQDTRSSKDRFTITFRVAPLGRKPE